MLTRQIQDLVTSTALLGMQTDETEIEMARLNMLLEYEDAKLENYTLELARRRHNYLPFIIALLQVLAENKKLSVIVSSARERIKKRGHKRMKT